MGFGESSNQNHASGKSFLFAENRALRLLMPELVSPSLEIEFPINL
jgi:hypothetical protein